MEFGLEI